MLPTGKKQKQKAETNRPSGFQEKAASPRSCLGDPELLLARFGKLGLDAAERDDDGISETELWYNHMVRGTYIIQCKKQKRNMSVMRLYSFCRVRKIYFPFLFQRIYLCNIKYFVVFIQLLMK